MTPKLSRAEVEESGGAISDSAIALLRLIHEDIQALHTRQDEAARRQDSADAMLSAHAAREERMIAEFMEAFPDGPGNHRRAHESMIAAGKAQERFWNELRLDIAKKGVWGLLIVICGLILVGMATKFGIVVKP